MKIHKYTIDALLERLRDVDRSVREQALERIGTVELKYLKLRHRIICVDTGLKDRDPIVKAKCLSMCQKWLSSRNNSLCEVSVISAQTTLALMILILPLILLAFKIFQSFREY